MAHCIAAVAVAWLINASFPAVVAALVCAAALTLPWSYLAGLAGLVAAVLALKRITGRERPDLQDRASFPSGHAAVAVYLSSVLAFSALPRAVALLVAAWAAAACYARVAARRHYWSDVLAGGALGLLAATAVHRMTLKNDPPPTVCPLQQQCSNSSSTP